MSELTSLLKRNDPLCEGNRCFNFQNKLNHGPKEIQPGAWLCVYGQHCEAAVTLLEWDVWQVSRSVRSTGSWTHNAGSTSKWGPLIYQKAWMKNLEDAFAIARLWVHRFGFGGEPCCRSLVESSSQDWTNRILELTFRHPGKTAGWATGRVSEENTSGTGKPAQCCLC